MKNIIATDRLAQDLLPTAQAIAESLSSINFQGENFDPRFFQRDGVVAQWVPTMLPTRKSLVFRPALTGDPNNMRSLGDFIMLTKIRGINKHEKYEVEDIEGGEEKPIALNEYIIDSFSGKDDKKAIALLPEDARAGEVSSEYSKSWSKTKVVEVSDSHEASVNASVSASVGYGPVGVEVGLDVGYAYQKVMAESTETSREESNTISVSHPTIVGVKQIATMYVAKVKKKIIRIQRGEVSCGVIIGADGLYAYAGDSPKTYKRLFPVVRTQSKGWQSRTGKIYIDQKNIWGFRREILKATATPHAELTPLVKKGLTTLADTRTRRYEVRQSKIALAGERAFMKVRALP